MAETVTERTRRAAARARVWSDTLSVTTRAAAAGTGNAAIETDAHSPQARRTRAAPRPARPAQGTCEYHHCTAWLRVATRGYAWLRVATRGVANATGKRTPEAAFACVYGNGNGTRAHPRVELNRCVR